MSTLVVTGAAYDARRDDTAGRIVIAKDELLRHGDLDLVEALKRQPGITVGSSGGISLRGLGNGYTQILVNGQKPPLGFNLESLSPEMIDRVEIIRSTTADIRAEGIAGTINVILNQASRKNSRTLKTSVGTSGGRLLPQVSWHQSQQDGYQSFAVDMTAARRELLVHESGEETGVDSMGTPNLLRTTAARSESFRDTISVAPSYSFKSENRGSFSAQGHFDASNFNRYTDVDWHTLFGPELEHVRYEQFTGINVVQLQGDVSWSYDLKNGASFTTKLRVGGNREESRFREQGYAIDGMQNLDDQTDGRLRVAGVNSTGKYSFTPLGEHRLELGWEGSVDRRKEERVQRLAPIAGEAGYFSDLSFDAQVRRLAFYGQDDWTISLQWSMYLGLRGERIEIISEGSEFERIRNTANIFSPVLQTLWKLPGTKNDQIRFSVSRTYKSPALRHLIPRPYTSTNNRPLNPDQQGNPDLRPELATGVDLTYEKYWSSGAQASFGGYARRIEDVVRSETRLIDGRWVSSPYNGGDASARGLELDAKFNLAKVLPAAPSVDVRFNATRNWSQVDDVSGPDNRVGEQPKLSSTLGIDYAINPTWTVGSSYTYQSGGSIRITQNQIDSRSARRGFDAYSLWKLSDKSKLRITMTNMLEQDVVTGTEYFLDDGSQRIDRFRNNPLTVSAQLELQL